LEQLQLRDAFDTVIGSSAGAINGAYFLAGQARFGTTIFYENINNRRFINFYRLFAGRSVVSLEFLLDEVCCRDKRLRTEDVISSDIPLFVVASSVYDRKSAVLSNFSNSDDLMQALRASARIPLFAGAPVSYFGKPYLDASMYESIPIASAANLHATDVVILLTRPLGRLRSNPNFIDRLIIAPYLNRLALGLGEDYLYRANAYKSELNQILTGIGPAQGLRSLIIAPSKEEAGVSSLERNRTKLVRGAMSGYNAILKAFGIPEQQLVEIIAPFAAGILSDSTLINERSSTKVEE
jgi:predicted patatin/cPLA2 family phospholipase